MCLLLINILKIFFKIIDLFTSPATFQTDDQIRIAEHAIKQGGLKSVILGRGFSYRI